MIAGIRKILSVPDLKKKVVFTLLLLLACRIGVHIPVPGINGDAAADLFRMATGGRQNLFQLMDLFSGGAFAQMTITALGVMPYITASIVMQLASSVVPSLHREMKENPDAGRRKVGKWTRTLTLLLSFFQAGIFGRYALQLNASHPGIIVDLLLNSKLFGMPWLFFLVIMVTMTVGTLLLMWIGEQITERGVGNGISLIISIGILSSLPTTLGSIIRQLNLDSQEAAAISFGSLIVLLAVFVTIIIGTILIIQGQRNIPVQYARRVVGRREVQGGSAHIPLKINYAGVIPVIMASAVLMFPATIAQLAGQDSWIGSIANMLSPGNWVYTTFYVLMIFFFTYVWTSFQFHPDQIASDMKKNGAFIPGVRQGKPTQEYLESSMNRITLAGAVFLALIAILPTIIGKILRVDSSITYFFGGTSLLILVGVVLDTTKQIESHLISKRYEGFMKQGRVKGR